MKLEGMAYSDYLRRELNVSIRFDEYELIREGHQREGFVLALIIERIVEKVSDAFIEQNQQELLESLDAQELTVALKEKVAEQLAINALKKLAS